MSIRLILFLPLLFLALQAHAATEGELRARIDERNTQIKALEEEIARYQKTLSETTGKSNTLKNEIVRIETQIKKLNADLRLTESRIGATELKLDELDAEIHLKEADITRNKAVLRGTLQALHERDDDSLLEVMLKNERISDFFGDLENIQALERTVQTNLAALRDLKGALEGERDEKERQRRNLAALRNELGDRKTIEDQTKRNRSLLLTQTKSREAQYQKILREREVEREQALAEIQRIEDDLRKLINPEEIPAARSGVLAWPIQGAVLTQNFGATLDSQILYNGQPHNGIDIRASVGTNVLAAETGTVREVGDTDAFSGCLSYGKWVLIDHPNNLSTLYAHLSLIRTQKGATVSRGDLIGYSGATGYATGPHLHFTVYDSKTVQFRASSVPGSRCKFLPYGGYVNPMAYL